MTEPDEALLWAREELVKVWEQSNASRKDIAIRVPAIRAGDYDRYLHDDVYLRRSWLDGHRAGAAASAERIKELEARVAELEEALAKANTPHWYYSDEEGSPWHSLEEALEQVTDDIRDLYHGDDMLTNHLVQIETARPCPTIWGVVRLLTEDEAEARLTEEPWVFTRCATEAEARVVLAKYRGEA